MAADFTHKDIDRISEQQRVNHKLEAAVDLIHDIDTRSAAIEARLMQLDTYIATSATNTASINSAITMIANTLKESQQANEALVGLVAGKKQIPLTSHYAVTATMCLVVLAGVLAWFKIDLEMSATRLQLKSEIEESRHETQKAKEEIKEAVEATTTNKSKAD